MVTWSCLGFPFAQVPTSIFLVWNLTAGSPSKTMCMVLSPVSQIFGIFRLLKRVFVDTSVLLLCYSAFVLLILKYFSPVWGSAAECHLQLLERQVYSLARPSPDQTFLSLCHQCHVASLCMLYTVNLNWNHCLLSELPSASVRVWHTRAVAAAHPLEFEVWRCRMSQFARCFLPAQTHVLNNLPFTVFDTGMFDGFMGAVNCWLLHWVCFSVFCGAGACGVV